ncbi:MAG: hypothetical protein ABF649_00985 [Bacillus sp. (in: firmicutes)]
MKTSKKAILIFMFILFLFAITEKGAFAKKLASDLKISTEVGFDGKVVEGKGYPITISIENTGKTFKGNLLLPYASTYETAGSKVLAIDLPANSKKTYSISLAGLSSDGFANGNNTIRLFKGDWQDGEEVSFTGTKNIKTNFITDYTFAILSDQYDQYKDLRDLQNDSMKTMELTKDRIPDSSIGLEGVNYLLIDNFSLTELSELKQKAIQDWIVKGGVLITGSQPNSEQNLATIQPLLPLQLGKEITISSNSIHNGKFNDFSLPAYETTLANGAEMITGSNNNPLIAKKTVGNGLIVQTAFSLHDPSLLASDSYADWFEQLFLSEKMQPLNNQQYSNTVFNDMYQSFFEFNEYFKGSNFSIPLIIGILLSYLLVIVPVLYFVLKKKDKREYAWWIIPGIAICLSIALFVIGAKDRIQSSKFNQMGIFQYENNYLTGYHATTLLSNNAGDYTISYNKSEYEPIPYIGYTNKKIEAVIEEKRKMNEINFSDVEYWSNRTIIGKAMKPLKGGFEQHLNSTPQKLTGTVKNNFPYDFSVVYIWSGKDKIKIGSLKAGETKTIDAKKQTAYFTAPVDSTYQGIYPGDYKGKDLTVFREKVVETAISQKSLSGLNNESKPIIYGITNDEITSVNLAHKKVQKNNTNIIMEPISLHNHFAGNITFTEENFDKSINILNGAVYNGSYMSKGLMLENGEYNYYYQIPDSFNLNKISFESLTLQGNGAGGANFTIYNNKTKKYQDISGSFSVRKKEVDQYVSVKGKITLGIKKNSNGDPYVSLPNIKLKGEIKE